MEYIIISFRSRIDTFMLSDNLKKWGIPSKVVLTPKEANIGCGLSVMIQTEYYKMCKKIVYSKVPKSFVGFFLIKEHNNRKIIKMI